jgi:hypothetical protein
MAVGFAPAQAAGVLNALGNATNYTAPAQFWIKLHVGDPGAAGTANPAANTTRHQVSFSAAVDGRVSNDVAIVWSAGETATETLTHWSAWTLAAGGTFLYSGTMPATAVTVGGTFTVPVADLDINLLVAAGVDPPDPEPGEITHGEQVTTTNTGWQGLGLTVGQLTPSGSVTTSSDGQLLQFLDINGQVNVNHDNVTIRGCRITVPVNVHAVKVNFHAGSTTAGAGGLQLEFCELRGPTSGSNLFGVHAIRNTPSTEGVNVVHRCYIHELGHTTHISGGWELTENYMRTGPVVAAQHNDGVFCAKAPDSHQPSLAIRRNRIIMATEDGSAVGGTAAVFLNTGSGDIHDVDVEDNWLQCSGESWGVRLGTQNFDFLGTTTITGNWFVQGWPPSNPGPESAISIETPSTVVRSGNRFVDIDGNDLGPVPGG